MDTNGDQQLDGKCARHFLSAAFVCEHIQLIHCILDTMRLIKAQEISAGLLKLGLTVTQDHLSRIMQVLSSTLRVFPPRFTVSPSDAMACFFVTASRHVRRWDY